MMLPRFPGHATRPMTGWPARRNLMILYEHVTCTIAVTISLRFIYYHIPEQTLPRLNPIERGGISLKHRQLR